MTQIESMEEKIATALRAPDDVSAATFSLLLRWVDAKTVVVERDVRVALAHSLDPATIDPSALGRAHDAEHFLKRLENSKAALTTHLQAATRREAKLAWENDVSDLELEVAKTADEMLETYPRVTNELVDLFQRAKALDAKVDVVNANAPAGCRSLRKVEPVARNIQSLNQLDTSVIEKTVLPPLPLSHNEPLLVNAWPPPAPNIGLEYSAMIASMISGPRTLPPSEEARVAAAARHIAHGQALERDHERANSEAAERRRAAAGG